MGGISVYWVSLLGYTHVASIMDYVPMFDETMKPTCVRLMWYLPTVPCLISSGSDFTSYGQAGVYQWRSHPLSWRPVRETYLHNLGSMIYTYLRVTRALMYQELSVCKEYLRYWGCQYVDISKLGKHWITSLPFRSGKVRASRKIREWLFRLIVMGRMDLTYIQCCAWYRYTMEIPTTSNNGINNTCT